MSEVIKSDDENSWDFLDLLNSPKPSENPKAFNWMSDKQNKAPSNPTQIKKEYLNKLRRKLMAMYIYKNVITNVTGIINKLQNGEFNDLNN